jgi:2-polyprenyl-6-methoxyphenol hydroxylase-like FAD-dependent oxidoreductase
MTPDPINCCIAGGGPAGMMLGVLLARAGVPVVVLEKHADFLRDFRGDTVHPSTLEVIYELGLLDQFLARPHSELHEVRAVIGDERITVADFSHLPVHAPFIALVPQWHFLDFLAEHGRRYPGFTLMMQAEVFELIEADGRIAGVRAQTPDGTIDVHAHLVVAADGRSSMVRTLARLPVQDIGAPIDVLWVRISKQEGDTGTAALGNVRDGRVVVMLDRHEYWQCAFVIPKGGYDERRRRTLRTRRADRRRSAGGAAPASARNTSHSTAAGADPESGDFQDTSTRMKPTHYENPIHRPPQPTVAQSRIDIVPTTRIRNGPVDASSAMVTRRRIVNVKRIASASAVIFVQNAKL